MNVAPSPLIPECGKIGHPSRKIALENLARVLAGQDAVGRDRVSLHIFRCQTCALWHLGNNDRARKLSARDKGRPRRAPSLDDYDEDAA